MFYSFEGHDVQTPEGHFWVAPNAVLIGQVTLEEDSSVWFGCTLRGDNEPIRIGARSNIQDGSVLHTDPGFPLHVHPDVTVGHMAMLHGCTVHTGSLIGINAVVLNGAVIGENCLIGAKALIPEGKIIPPGSLVMGVPGKVVGQVTPDQIEHMRAGTQKYVRRSKLYADQVKPQ
jgi:carbonic anhydrase/acetyltransferase-like protein (isoleucine patch superfamily)